MYKKIVRAQVRAVFEHINAGNYQAMLDSFAPSFEYRFHGDHALGGGRTTRIPMVQWWERVLCLLPGAIFDIREVMVNGGPWRTRVSARMLVSGNLPGGARYENTVFQFMTLRWGKVVSVETLENLQVLEEALRKVAESGQAEALAGPIVDAA
ncbi:nuclear transport factor 2 family protein [Rothia nasisuis]|uniref:nuclear transport factor 2 family protein n=1 Tax=Rothia nasisuis TaxID=2109647 RepID=UPI001F18A255|nr:nuclear transport factor 2 family protein [Rothia nasisuis]